jgi:hypothetical protein
LPPRVEADAWREDLPCDEAEAPRDDLLRVEAELPLRDDRPRAEAVPRLRDSPVLRPLADLLFEDLLREDLPFEDVPRELRDELPLDEPLLDDALLELLLPDPLLPDLLPDDEDRVLREPEDDDREEPLRALLLERCAMKNLLLIFAMRTRAAQMPKKQGQSLALTNSPSS